MAKTQEELNAIKEEVESMNKKLAELTDEELKQVTGGNGDGKIPDYICYNPICEYYGQHVTVSVGPPAANGKGIYFVCDFCGELITTPGGTPINFDVIT